MFDYVDKKSELKNNTYNYDYKIKKVKILKRQILNMLIMKQIIN